MRTWPLFIAARANCSRASSVVTKPSRLKSRSSCQRSFDKAAAADAPPKALVDPLATVFLTSDGDLGAVIRALVETPIAWEAPLAKLRPPQEFLVAAMRVIGAVTEPGAVVEMLNNLGQPLWQPTGPNGWGDTVADWAAPQAMTARLDLAAQWGRRNDAIDPLGLAEAVFGAGLTRDTRDAIARAESRRQGLAILLMAPEMHRR